ncbi:MAG: ribonuclease III [Bdellovibrionia bacterium]
MITSDLELKLTELQEKLTYSFIKRDLLIRALTHKSYDNENSETSVGHNEVFEFLGDAVLDLGLGHILMQRFGTDDEGGLSKKRASLVNEAMLGQIALGLSLDGLILLGRGEKTSGGARKPRLLASTLEALFGAVFLDSGFDNALKVIRGLFDSRVEQQDWSTDFVLDYKTRLQEKIQSENGMTPHYVLLSQTGPDHEKIFEVEVRMGEQWLATGMGSSKKAAEQEAARKALDGKKE